MRKALVLVLIASVLLVPAIVGAVQYQKSPAAAGLLSMVLPGAGEWYNGGWQGSYPWVECIAGHICCLVQISSVMDAVNGNETAGAMRIDFWSAPSN